MSDPQSTTVHSCLARLQAGDDSAREELLSGVSARFRQLCHLMLQDYPRLQRWEETGDVYTGAMLRLHRALGDVTPESARHFYRLAALQIRRELRDLCRHHFGPQGAAAHHDTQAADGDGPGVPAEPADDTHDPQKVGIWTKLHEAVEQLPDAERETFDLLWYHQLTQTEAAEVLGISRRTVIRQWQSACLRLHEELGCELIDHL